MKLIDGYSGEVVVNGIELEEISERSYREQCAAVSQKVFLFNDTIYNNIVYGMTNVTLEHYERAIRLSGLDVVLRLLPDGEKTIVGENGSILSGGEKQKVSNLADSHIGGSLLLHILYVYSEERISSE